MLKLKIGQRALLLFVLLAVIPVLALNTYWLISQQAVLRDEAKDRQALLTDSAASRVNAFMAQKISALILHAQTSPVLQNDTKNAKFELTNYIKQDKDIRHITLMNKAGGKLVEINSDATGQEALAASELPSTETAFKVVTFLGGKEYISPVSYVKDRPYVQIAVPVLTFEKAQDFSQLSTSERGVIRNTNDINGALVVLVDLSSVWDTVFASEGKTSALSYIIDDKKRLISHPDPEASRSYKDLSNVPSVKYFFDDPAAKASHTTETTGLGNAKVLTTYARVPLTNWAVITEEPITNIEAVAQDVATTVWLLDILVAGAALVVGYFFSRSITGPVRRLAQDASVMGSGNFDKPIEVRSGDEIGSLAQSLNTMSQKLKVLIASIASERNQLDVVLNSISEGVFALGTDGNIKLANQTALRLFGISEERVLSTKFSELASFHQDSSELRIDVAAIDPQTRIAEYRDLQFTDPDGTQHYVDIVAGKLEHAENGIGYIVTIIDQTASRELEAMKVDFVSLAAHELRTPLTAIRGYLELMLSDKENILAEKHRHYVLQANNGSVQLSSLINNLLDVSKIERNALNVSMEKHDLADTVSSSVRNQQFNAEKAEVRLTYHGPEKDAFVVGDPVALREVIDNLIINALHYTPSGGKVDVALEQSDDNITVHVKDTGVGIPKDALPKLFTKFFRVHGGLATGSGGSGLGLFISRSLVNLHYGSIWAESEEGTGSTFSFRIPVFDEARLMAYRTNGTEQPARRRRGWVTKNSTR